MCTFIAMAGISAATTLAGAYMQSRAAGEQARGAQEQARAQELGFRLQAQQADRQRVMEQQAGAYESARLRDKNARLQGRNRAAFLSSGVALEGSPTDVLIDSATESSLDEQAIRFGAKVRADNYGFEGRMARMNAGNARLAGQRAGRAGRTAQITPFISAAGDIAGLGMQRTLLKGSFA